MTDKQPKALRLADALERMVLSTPWDRAAAAELRRLHAVNQRLVDALQQLVDAANDSDGCQYGTLSTTFVRDIAEAALTEATGEQK